MANSYRVAITVVDRQPPGTSPSGLIESLSRCPLG